tara:strand:- start:769 stop:1275 length:507 start_codon:yes stop_codon:yes gene_type:complete
MTQDEWETFKKSVDPLKDRKKISFKKKATYQVEQDKKQNDDFDLIDVVASSHWGDLEKNILKKIQKGKMRISATLDLHGQNIKNSKKLVYNFINKNFDLQNRLLLLITGKGKRVFIDDEWMSSGKLKANIPLWLSSVALSNKIIWFDYAPKEKGGEGAFLIYLKKAIK